MQDGVVARNRAEFEAEYRWLDEAVELLSDVQIFVNDDPTVIAMRKEPEAGEQDATSTVVNLVNDAMGSLINAIRLLLFGAHADAFALVRNAFEACCYAEHFALRRDKVKAYSELEGLLSQDLQVNLGRELRERGLHFSSIRAELETLDSQDRGRFYARLCNLGAHPSPFRVGLRLSAPKGAVLAPVSVSTPE